MKIAKVNSKYFKSWWSVSCVDGKYYFKYCPPYKSKRSPEEIFEITSLEYQEAVQNKIDGEFFLQKYGQESQSIEKYYQGSWSLQKIADKFFFRFLTNEQFGEEEFQILENEYMDGKRGVINQEYFFDKYGAKGTPVEVIK